MNDDVLVLDKVSELIRDAAQQANDTHTKVTLCYDDDSTTYTDDAVLIGCKDIHLKISVEPKE